MVYIRCEHWPLNSEHVKYLIRLPKLSEQPTKKRNSVRHSSDNGLNSGTTRTTAKSFDRMLPTEATFYSHSNENVFEMSVRVQLTIRTNPCVCVYVCVVVSVNATLSTYMRLRLGHFLIVYDTHAPTAHTIECQKLFFFLFFFAINWHKHTNGQRMK